MNDLVSVIIPYYNNNDSIIRAIDSVVSQTYKNIELILINDGSTDNSYQIVESYIKTVEIPFCVIHLSDSNKGPSKARNKGIESSTGDFIAFLDADDSWTKDKLHKQMKIFSENPHIDLLGCNINIISSSTKKSVKHSFSNKKLSHITFRKLLYKHYFTPSAIIVKRDVIFSCGMFKEDQRFMEDSLLFSKIARNYNSFISCEFLLNTYKKQYGDKGLSANLNQMQYHEMKNFLLLYKENNSSENKLSLIEYMACNIFSVAKFLRRKIIVILSK